jgi:hypothetical protein
MADKPAILETFGEERIVLRYQYRAPIADPDQIDRLVGTASTSAPMDFARRPRSAV